jgi:hypothetical protein
VKKYGKRKAFHTGGNSSCRQHIRQHYIEYQKRCKEENIPEHHWAIPRSIWRQMEEGKRGAMVQGTLSQFIGKPSAPSVFTREEVLHVVTQFVAVDDQASTYWKKEASS